MSDHEIFVPNAEERDEFLRAVVAELQPDNRRWPGLWSRTASLLAERDALAAEVRQLREALSQHHALGAMDDALIGDICHICKPPSGEDTSPPRGALSSPNA